MGASRAELQVSFSWPHRELVLRFLREISPQKSISARHKTTKRGRHGQPPTPQSQPGPPIAVLPQKAGPEGGRKLEIHFIKSRRYRRWSVSLIPYLREELFAG